MMKWLTWGPLVFKRAMAEDKPICLFVTHDGYWSRVQMRRVSRDEQAVSWLTQQYIPVHVNAEEYPEVSNFALEFLKVSSGRAGWPLVLWLTPSGEPIMSLNSLALEDDIPKRFGLITHLRLIARHWRDPAWSETNAPALERIRALSDLESLRRAGALSYEEYMIDYAERWILRVDPVWGGFSSPFKFPLPLILSGLLGVWNQLGHSQHLHVVEYSLQQLLRGGVYDHVGGGVWRYSVDELWSSGCYEKLLIDQAHFTMMLTSLYRITKKRIYGDALRSAAQLICDEFASPDGGFVARIGLEDHDASQLQMGAFHQASWSHDEIRSLLEPQDAEWFIESFLSPTSSSIREDHYDRQRYLPRVDYPLNEEESEYWRQLRVKLLKARKSRHKLDRSPWRVCTDNAVASVALARAALVLDEPSWFQASRDGMTWLREHLWDGLRLWRAYRDRERISVEGCLEDYMSMTWSLAEISTYTNDPHDAHLAEVIFDRAYDLFKDPNGGGFFHAPLERRRLLPIAEKPTLDGVDLSGNAWAMLALKRLTQLTSSPFHRREFTELAERFAGSVSCQTSSVVSVVGALLNRS